jgi:hypothetical protein
MKPFFHFVKRHPPAAMAYEVQAWYDPRLPSPDSQLPLYQGQNRVRRLNGPKQSSNVINNNNDYQTYYELYQNYLKWRLPFLKKPRCVPVAGAQAGTFRILAWEDVLAQKLREVNNDATHPEYTALVRHTAQVTADYVYMWNQLNATIDELADCNYVHSFGGREQSRLLDTTNNVDVTSAGIAFRPTDTNYVPSMQQLGYKTSYFALLNAQGVSVQHFSPDYATMHVPHPLQNSGTLTITKHPATSQKYKSLLWAAVNGT